MSSGHPQDAGMGPGCYPLRYTGHLESKQDSVVSSWLARQAPQIVVSAYDSARQLFAVPICVRSNEFHWDL